MRTVEDITAKLFEMGYDRDEIEDKIHSIISSREEESFFHEESIDDLKEQHFDAVKGYA